MAQMQDTTSAMTEAESERGRILDGLRAEQAAARAATRDGLEQVRWQSRKGGDKADVISTFASGRVFHEQRIEIWVGELSLNRRLLSMLS